MAVSPAIKDNFFMYNSCSKFFCLIRQFQKKEGCQSESIILVFEKINHGFIKYLQTFADFEKKINKTFFQICRKNFYAKLPYYEYRNSGGFPTEGNDVKANRNSSGTIPLIRTGESLIIFRRSQGDKKKQQQSGLKSVIVTYFQ